MYNYVSQLYNYCFTGYRWSDGSNFDMAMWEDGEPNNLRYLEPCVVANTEAPYKQPIKLSWNDKYCLGHHDYVCQIPTGGFDLKQANCTLCRLIKYPF